MRKLVPLLLTTMLTACNLAPDFTLPDMKSPSAFKETPTVIETETEKHGSWKKAESLEDVNKGLWWKAYGDEALNKLEESALAANQTLSSAASRVEEARGLAGENSWNFLPDFDIGANAVRAKPSNATLATFGSPAGFKLKPYNLFSASGVLSYEADLFGRARNNYNAYLLDADAQSADYNNILLTLQADVASNYFSIRAIDSEMRLVRDTVDIREKALRIMQRKYDVGSSGEADLTRTMSELSSTRADLTALERQRNILEHAMAVLLGQMPSEFTLAAAPLIGSPPEIPPGLPSTLLERRPDIAAARFSMEAANERIGIARAAFFPIINLTASGGYQSTQLGELLRWSNRTWALGQTAGAAITMPIFENGRNFAALRASHSAYDEAVSNYKQAVLVGFRDVEDNLSDQRLLATQSQQQDEAASASARTTEVEQTRYDNGDVDFFEVVDTQRVSLAAERLAVQVRGQRFLTSIALVRALGGGWDTAASTQLNKTASAPAIPAEAVAETPIQPKPALKKTKTSAKKTAKVKTTKTSNKAPMPPMFENAVTTLPRTPLAPAMVTPPSPADAAFDNAITQHSLQKPTEEPASEQAYPSNSHRPSFSTPLN